MSYFTHKELECKCGCGLNNIDSAFMEKITIARKRSNIPFNVKSACRCEEHNRAEGGKPTSDHLTGQGMDVSCETSFARWRIVRYAIAAGIIRIGIGKTFVHLGDNLNNPSPRIWLYW